MKQNKLELPYPVPQDCQVPGQKRHGWLLPKPPEILQGQGQGTSKECV